MDDMCYDRRRAEACVDESARHAQKCAHHSSWGMLFSSLVQKNRKESDEFRIVGGLWGDCVEKKRKLKRRHKPLSVHYRFDLR